MRYTWADLEEAHDAAVKTTLEKWWKSHGKRVYLAQCEVMGQQPLPGVDEFPKSVWDNPARMNIEAGVAREAVWSLVKHGKYLTTKRHPLVVKPRLEAGWKLKGGKWVK